MGRRSRQWTFEEKRAAVELSRIPECGMPGVASCLGIDPALIYAWRRELREMADGATLDEPMFLPAVIEPDPISATLYESDRHERSLLPPSMVQIAMEVGGVSMMVVLGASPALVSRVIDALRRTQ